MKGKLAKDVAVDYKNDYALGTWAPLSLCGDSQCAGSGQCCKKEAAAPCGKSYHLDIFVDKCSVELFVDGGRIAMTNQVFPTAPYNHIKVYAEGGKAEVKKLTAYRLGL